MNSEETKQWIERVGVMPVLRARSEREGHALVEALVAGGITVIYSGNWEFESCPRCREL